MNKNEFDSRLDKAQHEAVEVAQKLWGGFGSPEFKTCVGIMDTMKKHLDSIKGAREGSKCYTYSMSCLEVELDCLETYVKNNSMPSQRILPTYDNCFKYRKYLKKLYQSGVGDYESYTRFTIVRHPFGRVSELPNNLKDNAREFVIQAAEECDENISRGPGQEFNHRPTVRWGYNHAIVRVHGGLDV